MFIDTSVLISASMLFAGLFAWVLGAEVSYRGWRKRNSRSLQLMDQQWAYIAELKQEIAELKQSLHKAVLF